MIEIVPSKTKRQNKMLAMVRDVIELRGQDFIVYIRW